MTQIDELERLSALRKSGALTEAEFATAKAKLLNGTSKSFRAGPLAISGLVLAIILLGTVAVLAIRQPGLFRRDEHLPSQAAIDQAVAQTIASSQPVQADQQPAVQASPASLLQRVFQRSMLGAQIAYLESMTGPARNVTGNLRTYSIQGCEVEVTVASGSIRSLGIPYLSPKCTVSLADFGFHGAPPETLTFGNLYGMGGGAAFVSDCIHSCGNAADPIVYGIVETAHVNGFIAFKAGVTLVGDAAIKASMQWDDAMTKAEGEEFVEQTQFNCIRRYDPLAMQLFKNVRITSIEVGFIDVPRSCARQ